MLLFILNCYHYFDFIHAIFSLFQAYIAIANYEKYLRDEGKGRKLTIITENIDGLHLLAGSTDVIEMEGNIFKTKCLLCGQVVENRVNPICPSLKGRG